MVVAVSCRENALGGDLLDRSRYSARFTADGRPAQAPGSRGADALRSADWKSASDRLWRRAWAVGSGPGSGAVRHWPTSLYRQGHRPLDIRTAVAGTPAPPDHA